MTKQEIQAIVESQNLSSAVFEAELYTDMTDVYYSEFEKLPEWLQNAISSGDVTVEESWDQNYWGSDSVVQIQLLAVSHNEVFEKMDAWKDEHESEYAAFCNKVEASIWQHMSHQENFEAFNAVMRGE